MKKYMIPLLIVLSSQLTVAKDFAPSSIKILVQSKNTLWIKFRDNSNGDFFRFYFNGKINREVISDKADTKKRNGKSRVMRLKISKLAPNKVFDISIGVIKNGKKIAESRPFTIETASKKHHLTKKEKLGKFLYSDKSLSKNRTMSCATCHDIRKGYTDGRKSPVEHMAAVSADGKFIADRNVPTNSYASFIPNFHYDSKNGDYVGGNFLNGSAKNLQEQAKGPFLNPIEMQMPSAKAVVERVKKNYHYKKMMKKIYGNDIFRHPTRAYNAIANAIASYEKTSIFSPFNSKYDRMLKGKYEFTEQEQEGLELFINKNKGNCIECHPMGKFTDYHYDNLGIPVNRDLRKANGKGTDYIDHGLLGNKLVNNKKFDGAFRVSSLRNVAQTAPYMHNGYFKTLKAVVHFYNTRDVDGAINPETGEVWKEAEVSSTIEHDELGNLGLTENEEDAIVAFLRTLSDKRYEK